MNLPTRIIGPCIVVIILLDCVQTQSSAQENVKAFINGCRKQLIQWIGFKQETEKLLKKCSKSANEDRTAQQQFLLMYSEFAKAGANLSLTHLDIFRDYMKKSPNLKGALNCLVQLRDTQNEYFNQQKRYKYFAKFIREQPNQGRQIFVSHGGMYIEKGKKLCNYLKAFFQHYYLNVLRPSQTTSTTFLRALTVRTDLFNHQDIAYCTHLETHGKMAQYLNNLDINNIYIQIPELFNSIKFIKFKKQCKSQVYTVMMNRIRQKLKGIDMFKVMYHEHNPFIDIATEKFGTSQIKLLARRFAQIIDNADHYRSISQEQM